MTEERLKEIKDYADFKMKLGLNEEKYIDVKLIKELYNEVIRLRETLINKPDTEWTLKTEDGQIMTIIQSERIDMQETLNKTITTLYERINKSIKYIEKHWKKNYHYEDIENCMTFCEYDKNDLLNILKGE